MGVFEKHLEESLPPKLRLIEPERPEIKNEEDVAKMAEGVAETVRVAFWEGYNVALLLIRDDLPVEPQQVTSQRVRSYRTRKD